MRIVTRRLERRQRRIDVDGKIGSSRLCLEVFSWTSVDSQASELVQKVADSYKERTSQTLTHNLIEASFVQVDKIGRRRRQTNG